MAFARFYFQILTATVVSMHENKDANWNDSIVKLWKINQRLKQYEEKWDGHALKTGERVAEMYAYIHYLMIVF